MDKIYLKGMEFYAYHGHYEEEKIAGTRISIDIDLWTDTSKAQITDNLNDALNYQEVYAIVNTIVKTQKFNLLEKLAETIISTLYQKLEKIKKVRVRIKKINPYLGGNVANVGVDIKKSYSTEG